MTTRASGTFEVRLSPQVDGEEGGVCVARMLIDKRFAGDLEGTSKGQMLAVRTATEGSAGYVAMELVTGQLGGRSGTFVLQHSSTMERGTPHQSITVVPDSGTDELVGLAGRLEIVIDAGGHSYHFDYTFGDAP